MNLKKIIRMSLLPAALTATIAATSARASDWELSTGATAVTEEVTGLDHVNKGLGGAGIPGEYFASDTDTFAGYFGAERLLPDSKLSLRLSGGSSTTRDIPSLGKYWTVCPPIGQAGPCHGVDVTEGFTDLAQAEQKAMIPMNKLRPDGTLVEVEYRQKLGRNWYLGSDASYQDAESILNATTVGLKAGFHPQDFNAQNRAGIGVGVRVEDAFASVDTTMLYQPEFEGVKYFVEEYQLKSEKQATPFVEANGCLSCDRNGGELRAGAEVRFPQNNIKNTNKYNPGFHSLDDEGNIIFILP